MLNPDSELLLDIVDLHASVEDNEILKGVNLQVRSGEIHAIMGRNGSCLLYTSPSPRDSV